MSERDARQACEWPRIPDCSDMGQQLTTVDTVLVIHLYAISYTASYMRLKLIATGTRRRRIYPPQSVSI